MGGYILEVCHVIGQWAGIFSVAVMSFVADFFFVLAMGRIAAAEIKL
jgi:hypothetical protein